MTTKDKKHGFHLVDPSPWPIYVSFATLVLAFGTVYYFHSKALWLLLVGFALVVYGAFMWWRDVVEEAEFQGHHSPIVQIGLRYGMMLFIASEVMFFVAFFWAFFSSSLFPVGGVWPPETITTFDPFDLPLINTLILLLSGSTATWAHHALIEDNRSDFILGLTITIFLGIFFTGLQALEYMHAPFGFADGIYPSVFFMATGFHGFHVLIGTIFLLVCLIRARKGHFSPEKHIGFEAAA